MPVIFTYDSYRGYFASHDKVEFVHIHVKAGALTEPATKVWLLSNGDVRVANNNVSVRASDLADILDVIRANRDNILKEWERFFGAAPRFVK